MIIKFADSSKRPGQDDDLPDVIEVVRAMGLDGVSKDTEAPSPTVPVVAPHANGGPPLPAHLEKLADRARDYVEAASSTNTRRAYAADGPLFRRVTGQGKAVGAERLNDQEVARLGKRAALAAGVRGDLSEGERTKKLPAIRCALASPPPPRSTSAMCRSNSATPAPR